MSIGADNPGVPPNGPPTRPPMSQPASVTPITTQNPDAAGVQRRHNEGHVPRLPAAFDAPEALPALPKSPSRLRRLVPAERIPPGYVGATVESEVFLVI